MRDQAPLLVWVIAVFSLSAYRSRHPSELLIAGGLDWEIMIQVGTWAAFGLLATYLVFSGRANLKLLRFGPLGWFAVLVLLGLLSATYSALPAYSLFRGGQMAVALVLVLAATNLRHKHLYQAAFFFVLLSMVAFLPHLVSGSAFSGGGFPRLGTRFGHASLVGIVAAAGASGLYARWARQGLTGWGYVGMIVLILGTLATVSRTAIAGLVLSVLVVSALTRRPAVPAAIAFVGLVILALELNTGSVTDFLSRGQTTFEMKTLTDRTVVWTAVVDRIRSGEVMGEGLGATRWQPPTDVLGLGHSHNAFLEAMISLGGAGGLLVLLVLVSWMARQFWLLRMGHGHWRLHIVDTENLAIFVPLAAFCFMDQGFMATIDQTLLFYVAAMRLAVDRSLEVRRAVPRVQAARSNHAQRMAARSVYAPGRLANPAASGRR